MRLLKVEIASEEDNQASFRLEIAPRLKESLGDYFYRNFWLFL
jgi:hypothetical protein